jgi:hypothetical protein
MTQHSHPTAPTQFVDAAGVRFDYRFTAIKAYLLQCPLSPLTPTSKAPSDSQQKKGVSTLIDRGGTVTI